MDKEEAKKILLQYARRSLYPKYAREVCEAFGIEFDEKLVYTKLRYRELSDEVPRVAVYELAQYISEKLGIEPDEKLLEKSHQMMGEGSRIELLSSAYTKNL